MLKTKLFKKIINVPFDYKNCGDKLVVYIDMSKIELPKKEKYIKMNLDGIVDNLNEAEMALYDKLHLPHDIEYRISGEINAPVIINSKGQSKMFIENTTLSDEFIINGASYVIFENNKYIYSELCHFSLTRQLIKTQNVGTIIFQNERIKGHLDLELDATNVCFYDSKVKLSGKNISIKATNTSLIDSKIISNALNIKSDKFIKHGSDIIFNEISINQNDDNYEKVKTKVINFPSRGNYEQRV